MYDADLAIGDLVALLRLYLFKCPKITGAGLASLGRLAALSLLRVEECALVCDADRYLAHLSGLGALRELGVVDCPAVRNLAHLQCLTALRALNVTGRRR